MGKTKQFFASGGLSALEAEKEESLGENKVKEIRRLCTEQADSDILADLILEVLNDEEVSL